MTVLTKIIFLFAGHVICDYPLQGDYLAKGKNRNLATCTCGKTITHVKCEFWKPEGAFDVCDGGHWHKPNHPKPWLRHLFDHSVVHAGMVLLITQSPALAIAELVIHFATDMAKCENRISSTVDQAIHYACKVLWAVL